ncbi:MAG: hypothetical protein HZB33_07375 [Nitrospirae bacterium]|nr:hypothetical protein [Nitrospirota bacterium]
MVNTSLHYIHRTEQTDFFYPSRMVPVEVTAKSLGSAFDLRIAETYPAEIGLHDPAAWLWITTNPWVSDVHIGPNETVTMLYYAFTPDIPGTYELKTEIQYADGGEYSSYQDLYAHLVVEKSTATINNDIIAALQALPLSGHDEVRAVDAVKSLQTVMSRKITVRTDVEQNIHDILKAADSLRKVTGADTSSIMLMLDGLLESWESRWYSY